MKTLHRWSFATALVLATASCNTLLGLDKDYSEQDCFPAGSCAEGGSSEAGHDGTAGPGDAGADGTLPSDADAAPGSDAHTPDGAPGDAHADAEGGVDGSADAGDAGPCPTGDLVCNGSCVPNDPHNCGTCGHDCTNLANVSGPVTCSASGQCSFPLSSCAPGWSHCSTQPDDGCETNVTVPGHCGSCSTICPTSAPLCSGSGSTYSCVSGCDGSALTLCGTSCVDTTSDPANCGTCGHACTTTVTDAVATCASSACSFSCKSGYTECGGNSCVDTQTDGNNCGKCGVQCTGGQQCTGSSCQCPAGQNLCGGKCVASSATACGASCTDCTTSAPPNTTPTCNGASCTYPCTSSATQCGNQCVDVTSDPLNCGWCGHSCAGATCQSGVCTPLQINSVFINGSVGGVGIDSSYVYFTTGSDKHVGRCPLSGCPTGVAPFWVLTLGESTGALFYDAATTNLYVSTPTTIYSATTTGTVGSINYQISNESSGDNFATDGTLLYWGASSGIRYANKATGTGVASVAGGIVGPVCGVWYDPGTSAIFGAECNDSGRVDKCAGGQCSFISSTAAVPFGNPVTVLVQGATLFFGAGGGGPGGLYSAPAANPANNAQEFAFGSSYSQPTALATDGARIYFASFLGGNIYSCPLAGCGAGPNLVAKIGGVTGMVLDSQYLYIGAGNGVYRVAK